ncbi:class I SAM-dependent methyltransferase [Sulfoacidibacillus thermotolerans]|nr:class I SAM-dependent methyltransferase [Sulfoacidibacillus thermotolerans]
MDYHDALAVLGASSAHPGGFSITKEWMDQIQIAKEHTVLEVGCGTGRTACALKERFDCTVIGVDRNAKMIQKARRRAATQQLTLEFLQLSGESMPFSDASFHWIVAESVTVFNELRPLLTDYYRLLKTDGIVIDVEMCASSPLPKEVFKIFEETYGARIVPTMTQWKQHYRDAGFRSVRILRSGPVPNTPIFDEDLDPISNVLLDVEEAYSEEVNQMMLKNQTVMQSYAKWLNFAVIQAIK